MTNLYQLNQVEYSYTWYNSRKQSLPILKGISLEIYRGEFVCFVGPSGTGKTTLLNLLGMIDRPTQGDVIFEGRSTSSYSESELEQLRLKKIGFVFQSFHLIPTLNVLENTSYFLPHLGLNESQSKERSLEILDLLGLADQALKRPLELSGGQRQRVAIARAMAKQPEVILADEPTANLDYETATKIIEAFLTLQKSRNTSFIFSTHDPHLVSMAKTVHRMKDGKVIENKNPSLKEPQQ